MKNIPFPGEFDDDNDFWKHPVYDNWEANRRYCTTRKNKKDIGRLKKSGYILICVYDRGIRKDYLKHRFIYECFHGLINDPKLVIDHINNIKTDNRLENLQLITPSQNQKKEHRKGEKIDHCSQYKEYNSINKYKFRGIIATMIVITKCSKGLDIHHCASIASCIKRNQ